MRIWLSFLVCVLAAGVAQASAASPMQNWSYLVGTWTCTTTGSAGKQTETDHDTAVGDNWIHIASQTSAGMGQAAHTGDGYLGYDSKKHMMVFVSVDSLGNYGMGKSMDAPDAATQTWSDLYPVNAGDGPVTIRKMSDTKYTIDTTFMMKGKKVSSHQVCAKT